MFARLHVQPREYTISPLRPSIAIHLQRVTVVPVETHTAFSPGASTDTNSNGFSEFLLFRASRLSSDMIKFRISATLILVLVTLNGGGGFELGLNDALDLIRLGRETVVELMESWDMIRTHNSAAVQEQDYLFVKRMEKELRQRIDRVSKKIDVYQERMEIKIDAILTQLLLRLPMQRRLDDSLRELDHYIGQVLGLYKLFERYAENPDRYEKYTMIQFAKSCVSPRLNDLPDVLKSIHRLTVPSEQQVYNRSILVLLADQMQVGKRVMTG